MAKISGIAYVISINGVALAWGSSATVERSEDAIDTTTKGSAGKKEFIPGDSSWTLSDEGKVDTTDTALQALKTAWRNRSTVTVSIPSPNAVPPTQTESGTAIITRISETFPEADASGYSVQLQGSGTLALA